MNLLTCLADFFAGAFICNSIPHLVSGLLGSPFPSPFAKPRGVGDSSPLVNFLWGSFNLFAGAFLFSRNPVVIGLSPGFLAFAAGFLVLGVQMSLHFGRVRHGRGTK